MLFEVSFAVTLHLIRVLLIYVYVTNLWGSEPYRSSAQIGELPKDSKQKLFRMLSLQIPFCNTPNISAGKLRKYYYLHRMDFIYLKKSIFMFASGQFKTSGWILYY